MRLTLYIVHGSHPCAAVAKALDLKGLEYRVVEWPPPLQAPLQKLIFGPRTVPGLKIGDEKISGSRPIMHRLDELAPSPALYPLDPERRAAVEEADRWGDEVFQPVARELIWAGMVAAPGAMVSYAEHSRLPMPPPAIRASAPLIARLSARLNRTNGAVASRDLAALPAQLDKIDGWIAAGVIGDTAAPNAADLQLGSTVRLLLTVGNARTLIKGRPCERHARELFAQMDGELPPGTLATAAASTQA